MYYELALISVVIAASYWGLYFIRFGPHTRTYGMMQFGAAVFAGLGLYHRRVGGPDWFGVAGAIGVGAGTCLLVVGPIVRAAARRFAGAERFKIAERLLDVADVLAPGSGVGEEKRMLAAMREIRDGNIEATVIALTAAREDAPAEARIAIDERIAMLYLAAYRWDDAIAHAEKNLFNVELSGRSELERNMHPGLALRRALGIAPPVWVELLGAYGYKGDLEQAARMLARLEEVCAGRAEAGIWVHRGRMIFLAHAGRVAAVEALVDPRKSRHMSRGARAYWIAVAHERKGDARGAELAYAHARSKSRGRPRVLIDRALERLSEIKGIELTPLASELVAQVEPLEPPVVPIRERPRAPWATRILTVSMLAVAASIALFVGDSSDLGVLVRAGAMVRGFIHHGEWWRIVTCNFIHVGGLHLLVNALGLWFLGRLCEDMFGTMRTFAIFAVAGIAGFIASDLASPVGISAGASGGIFGLLGAVFVELTLHKKHHRIAWNRGMWGSLVVVALGQFGLDVFMYSGVTDQFAHLGGALFGAVMGAVLSPHMRYQAVAKHTARVITGAFAIACVVSAVMVVRTPIAKSLGVPDHELEIGASLVAKAPADWSYDDTLHDPDDMIEVRFASSNADKPFDDFMASEQARMHKRFERIDLATVPVVPLPPTWTGQELSVSAEEPDAVGGREHNLLVLAAKQVRGGTILVSIEVTETMARAAPAFFTALVAGIDVK
ncbi:MAG: rhomboid family intramembrane serine protease [Kofleriaceae bacterium]